MNFKVDPSFEGTGQRARKRQRSRLVKRIAAALGGVTVLGLAGWGIVALLFGGGGPDQSAQSPTEALDTFEMVQTQDAADTGVRIDPMATFIDLRRDPMILRFERSAEQNVAQIAGPDAFVPNRAGRPGPTRLSVLQDSLFVAERRLVTTLPSTRDDFALFQAQRSQALEQGLVQPTLSAPALAGEVVRIEEDGSWGDLIEGTETDGDQDAVYVETRIENTTSTAVTARENQRQPLFEDEIVVLRAERALSEVLTANGLSPEEAALVTRAAERDLGIESKLEQGSIVALRLRGASEQPQLLQMSVYGPDGYIAALSQIGAGRFAAAADPWIEADLLSRSGRVRSQAQAAGDIRLLDALYSAAIRNGMSTKLVGEMIVIMSQRFDLDRFVSEGDVVTILFATQPGPSGQGLGQLLFVGIDGPSGKMPCYVTRSDTASGFACFDFNATQTAAGGAGLGGGLTVPVQGVKTSGFGPRHHPILKQLRNHNGVDWAAPTGTPVLAAAAGTITRAGDGGGYGNVVYIDHGSGTETRYAHLNAFAPNARRGAQVSAGDVIGYVGTTGRSTGPHLHFELRVAGKPINPLSFTGAAGGGSGAVEALVNQIIKVESAGNANAKNPLSTATGLGQFIQSTWLRMMRDYRPDLVQKMSREQLLALRTDPALSRQMVRNLARENESYLRTRGHQITPGRLYLAHFLGPAGADRALRANAQATVLEIMGAAVVNANPFLRGKTIADLRAWSDRKMRGAGQGTSTVVASAPTPRAVPADVQAYRTSVDEILSAL